MFNDKRGRKIIFAAHCILNQNSISDGTADFPACFRELIETIYENNYGIVQLPCPELCCLGIDRGNTEGSSSPLLIENTRIRESMAAAENSNKLKNLVDLTIYQITEYLKYDFNIAGIIGIDRSPSCGVTFTSKNNKETEGAGVFISLLQEELKRINIKLNFIGVRDYDIQGSLNKLNSVLNPGINQ